MLPARPSSLPGPPDQARSPASLGSRLCSSSPEPFIATTIARLSGCTYGGDPASADWRHMGRFAGFTNQKSARRTSQGYAPWVKIVHARAGLAPQASALVESARKCPPWEFAARSSRQPQ